MRRIDFNPESLVDPEKVRWWKRWTDRSDKATRTAIAEWEAWLNGSRDKEFTCKFKERVWKDLKEWLLEGVFQDKCAYCETDFPRSTGHAEHYRPKGSVLADKSGRRFARFNLALPPGNPCGEIQHPGYFWLAYHWENLVPACEFCNSNEGKLEQYPAKTHVLIKQLTPEEREGLSGKSWESPTWPGWYYLSSRDLDKAEAPLIINPLNPAPDYDPHAHLRFGRKGAISAYNESPIGKASIAVYNLDSEKLREKRQKAQESIQLLFFSTYAVSGDPAVADLKIESFRQHKEPYSSAALDFLDDLIGRLPRPSTTGQSAN